MNQLTDDKLIFIISQPRSGSTLLQRMLGTHSSIQTTSEPWLMLPTLSAVRDGKSRAIYNGSWCREAIHEFLREIPSGKNAYFNAVQNMALELYSEALSGKEYFLDKTPRYFYIIPELLRTFPNARFILLIRNPLAVLASIITTWCKKNLWLLGRYRDDILLAPKLIHAGKKILGERAYVVKFESLINNPEVELQKICKNLGIIYEPRMVNYGSQGNPSWALGDKVVNTHQYPSSKMLDHWIKRMSNPRLWRLSWDYLHILGSESCTQLGYSFYELRETLWLHRPLFLHRWTSIPLKIRLFYPGVCTCFGDK
jgi:hypothetical protein